MTYKELLNELNKMPKSQLGDNVTIKVKDEYYGDIKFEFHSNDCVEQCVLVTPDYAE